MTLKAMNEDDTTVELAPNIEETYAVIYTLPQRSGPVNHLLRKILYRWSMVLLPRFHLEAWYYSLT